MFSPYRAIFAAPGALGFSGAAFVARLPWAMTTLGIVTMLSQSRGEYGLAGSVAATFAFANALIAPQLSRLVDRFGQRRIAVPSMLLALVAFAALIVATRLEAPVWTLFLSAALVGFMPSFGALVRARWTDIYRGQPDLRTAFAFESVVDEAVYIVGPVLAIGLSVSLFPEAGPLAAAVLLAVGGAAFIIQRGTEPAVHDQGEQGASAIGLWPVRVIALVMVAIGAIFGTAEVATVAFAEAQGHKGAASLVLASYASGSLIVGLLFGTLRPRISLVAQLQLAVGLAMLTTLPLLIVGDLVSLAFVLFLAGASVSPTIIVAMGLMEQAVPPAKLTEGITWGTTGIGVGMALGSLGSGWVIDLYGASSGFWISIGAGVAALAIVVAGRRAFAHEGERGSVVACEPA
ncbi:MFS transporter [Bosea sp. Root381]|uniref:MFS transporter n=1 Tax=Bosea sp. Root381 TaxID=1736524 RepID=UPI0006F654E8|nr:MFS transporter [Bosea sp. Root381]KRE17955.1 MFS transporter [Bosea sp. Root381]